MSLVHISLLHRGIDVVFVTQNQGGSQPEFVALKSGLFEQADKHLAHIKSVLPQTVHTAVGQLPLARIEKDGALHAV